MTHRTLKLLGAIIQETISHYETKSGEIIPLDEKQVEEIRKRLNALNPVPDDSTS